MNILQHHARQRLKSAYVPEAGSQEQLAYLAQNVGDHLSVATENVLSDAAHFERALHVEGLTPDDIAELARAHEKSQMHLLEALQEQAEAMKEAQPGACRIRIGAYFYNTRKTE